MNPIVRPRVSLSLLVTASVLSGILCLCAGCTQSGGVATVDPAVLAKHQSERILAEQPANPTGIQELLIQLVGDKPNPATASADAVQVALLGKLGTSQSDGVVFQDQMAGFTMIDPSYQPATNAALENDTAESHDHASHDHAESDAGSSASAHESDCPCPFCQSSKETAPQAIVTFVGADGEPLPIDARTLFGLQGDELVVVSGSAKLSVGQLLVTADKIYVRK